MTVHLDYLHSFQEDCKDKAGCAGAETEWPADLKLFGAQPFRENYPNLDLK